MVTTMSDVNRCMNRSVGVKFIRMEFQYIGNMKGFSEYTKTGLIKPNKNVIEKTYKQDNID